MLKCGRADLLFAENCIIFAVGKGAGREFSRPAPFLSPCCEDNYPGVGKNQVPDSRNRRRDSFLQVPFPQNQAAQKGKIIAQKGALRKFTLKPTMHFYAVTQPPEILSCPFPFADRRARPPLPAGPSASHLHTTRPATSLHFFIPKAAPLKRSVKKLPPQIFVNPRTILTFAPQLRKQTTNYLYVTGIFDQTATIMHPSRHRHETYRKGC